MIYNLIVSNITLHKKQLNIWMLLLTRKYIINTYYSDVLNYIFRKKTGHKAHSAKQKVWKSTKDGLLYTIILLHIIFYCLLWLLLIYTRKKTIVYALNYIRIDSWALIKKFKLQQVYFECKRFL